MQKLYFLLAVIMLGISNFLTRIALLNIKPQYYQIISATVSTISIPIYIALLHGSVGFGELNSYSAILAIIATIIAIAASQIIAYAIHNAQGHIMNVNMWVALYPVVSFILSVIFLNETISCYKIIGIVLMIIGATIIGLT